MDGQEEFSATRTTTRLLDALRDTSNEPGWAHIDARYRPVLKGLARRLGVPESEADDVAQQTLAEFVRAYREGRYDRSKGRLSSWILGIAHHLSMGAIRRLRRESARGGDAPAVPESAGDDPPRSGTHGHEASDASEGEQGLRDVWLEERDRVILHQALATLHAESAFDERTLRAFELIALRGVPAPEAASQCGMSVDQVYVARSRVTRRLRSLVKEMTAAFEEDA